MLQEQEDTGTGSSHFHTCQYVEARMYGFWNSFNAPRDVSLKTFSNKNLLKKTYGLWRRDYSMNIHNKVSNLVVTIYNTEV